MTSQRTPDTSLRTGPRSSAPSHLLLQVRSLFPFPAPFSAMTRPHTVRNVLRDPVFLERSLGVVLWVGLIVVLLTKSAF